MGSELSMGTRAEITRKYATAYVKASKGDKGRRLDEMCAVTGWSRDNARRRLTQAANRPAGGAMKPPARVRTRTYSYDALLVLQKMWAASGGQCGKYLAASMPLLLDLLQAHGEVDDEPRYKPAVRAELEATSQQPSAATWHRRAPRILSGGSVLPRPGSAARVPSPSARPVTRSRLPQGSSRLTPSLTAARCSKASSPAP